MPTPPALSADQRKAAFDRSLKLRRIRAEYKAALKSGDFDMPFAFQCTSAQGMKVYDLLTALPGVGKAKALILLAQAGIPAKNTVRACGPKQRERLLGLLVQKD